MPFGGFVIYRHEKRLGFSESSGINQTAYSDEVVFLALIASAAIFTAVGIVAAAGAQFLNSVVSFVDLLHLFDGKILKRVVGIVVGMVLLSKISVCLFDFFVAGVFRNAEDLIGIVHSLFSFR